MSHTWVGPLPVLCFLLAAGTGCGAADNASPGAAPPADAAPAGLVVHPWTDALASEVSVEGGVVAGRHWSDRQGEALLVLTEGAEKDGNKSLYGYVFQRSGDRAWRQVRRVQDWIKDCPFDVLAEHLVSSVAVEDQDGDGVGEARFAYRLACRSDVSSPTLKLMVLEGGAKYALRGNQWDGERDPGAAKADDGFPPALLAAATDAWAGLAVSPYGAM